MTESDFGAVLRELARINEATHYVLLGIVALDFFGLVVAAFGLWVTRDVGRMQREMAEESRRLSFYLFGKLGPRETK
ncbi:MAG: hypothetical protein ACREQJ_05215 [Candidatus Binatia bacterium]